MLPLLTPLRVPPLLPPPLLTLPPPLPPWLPLPPVPVPLPELLPVLSPLLMPLLVPLVQPSVLVLPLMTMKEDFRRHRSYPRRVRLSSTRSFRLRWTRLRNTAPSSWLAPNTSCLLHSTKSCEGKNQPRMGWWRRPTPTSPPQPPLTLPRPRPSLPTRSKHTRHSVVCCSGS